MDAGGLTEMVRHWANDVLVWVGFGTLVGLAAKAILPGRDHGGAVVTLLMGIGGTVVGSGLLVISGGGQRVTPLSPLGFIAATAGSLVLLLFHRLLAGSVFKEAGTGTPLPGSKKGRRRVIVAEE